MGKLERKIKKQIKNETEDFNVWYDKNQDRLSDFSAKEDCKPYHKVGNVLVKDKRFWIPTLAVFCLIAIFLTVLLPILLNNRQKDFDFRFGDDRVYSTALTDAEFQTVAKDYPFINKMQITEKDVLRLLDDDSLVFTIIDGEVDTGDDYYFIKVQIEHDKNYEFGYKAAYLNHKNQTTVKDWKVTYEQGVNDANDLFVYFIRLEDSKGQVIYMEVHCFENDISYILNEFI